MKKIFVSLSIVFAFLTVSTSGMASYRMDKNCEGKYKKTAIQLKKIRSKGGKKGSAAHAYKQNCTQRGHGKFSKRRKNL